MTEERTTLSREHPRLPQAEAAVLWRTTTRAARRPGGWTTARPPPFSDDPPLSSEDDRGSKDYLEKEDEKKVGDKEDGDGGNSGGDSVDNRNGGGETHNIFNDALKLKGDSLNGGSDKDRLKIDDEIQSSYYAKATDITGGIDGDNATDNSSSAAPEDYLKIDGAPPQLAADPHEGGHVPQNLQVKKMVEKYKEMENTILTTRRHPTSALVNLLRRLKKSFLRTC